MGSDRYMEEHQFIGTGGIGHLGGGGGGTTPVPKRRTLEFDNLKVTYDSDTKVLSVEDQDLRFTFTHDTLRELNAAMLSLGLTTVSNSGMVTYR